MIFATASAGRSLRRANSSPDFSSDMTVFDRHSTLCRTYTNIAHSADAESVSINRGTRSKRSRPNDVWLFDRTRNVKATSAARNLPLYHYPSFSPLDPGLSPSPKDYADMFVASIAVTARNHVYARASATSATPYPLFCLPRAEEDVTRVYTPLIPVLTELDCPVVLAQVGLAHPAEFLLSSVVTVACPIETRLRVDTSIYHDGILLANNEDVALLTASNPNNAYEYSAQLAPDFLTRILNQHRHDHATTSTTIASTDTTSSIPHALAPAVDQEHSLVILRFVAQEFTSPKIVFVLACQFRVVADPAEEGFVSLWTPTLDSSLSPSVAPVLAQPPKLLPSPTIESEATFGSPTPPIAVLPSSIPTAVSAASSVDEEPIVMRRTGRRGNLTIAIPSAETYLSSKNFGPGTGNSGMATPLSATGGLLSVPQPSPSPLPITPSDKVMHAPLAPPPINRSPLPRRMDSGSLYGGIWAPTPTEEVFPGRPSTGGGHGIDSFYFDSLHGVPPTSCATAAAGAAGLTAFGPSFELGSHRGSLHVPSAVGGGALASPWAFGFDATKAFDFGGAPSPLRTTEF